MASANSTATVVVLTHFDLLEDILLRLPVREVLFTKRVCKAWKGVHENSTRIQKALFLVPATNQMIYYPNSSKPMWYLAPGREELIEAGLVSEPVDESDGDITPTNSPKQRNAHKKTDLVKGIRQVGSLKSEVATDGKFYTNVHLITAGEYESDDGETDGKVVVGPKFVCKTGGYDTSAHGGQAVVGMLVTTHKQTADGIQMAEEQKTTKNLILYNYKADSDETTDGIDSSSDINIFGRKASGNDNGSRAAQYVSINNLPRIPASPDGKMMVSRVTSPFINPFFELFFERCFRGSRGGYYPTNLASYSLGSVNLEVRPQIKLPDGTTVGRSRKTRAVQRYDASWRKMHPFSAITSSIEVECFDFGAFEVFFDFGMLAGHMMDQLGQHWGALCPDCCIPDFWFSEFVKDVCHTDNSHWNRGKHGVKKMGLNNTGWEILAKLSAGKIQATGVKDRIRPF